MTAEKRVLERRLKRRCAGLANAKARAQLRLRCAINFDVDLARSLQPVAHRRGREGGRVAIATEMTKHNALDPARQQLFDHARRRRVREMTMPRLDPLLHRPGPMLIVLQKFFVVVRLDHNRPHLPQTFYDHLRRVTEIGDEPETAGASMQREADRIDRVVRDSERFHRDVADGKA